jgi:hypothetical protein
VNWSVQNRTIARAGRGHRLSRPYLSRSRDSHSIHRMLPTTIVARKPKKMISRPDIKRSRSGGSVIWLSATDACGQSLGRWCATIARRAASLCPDYPRPIDVQRNQHSSRPGNPAARHFTDATYFGAKGTSSNSSVTARRPFAILIHFWAIIRSSTRMSGSWDVIAHEGKNHHLFGGADAVAVGHLGDRNAAVHRSGEKSCSARA